MKLPRFGVEEWLNVHEKEAVYDIAGVSISSLTLQEIIAMGDLSQTDFFAQLAEIKMDYGWIEGSPEFKTQVCRIYQNQSAENILQTNGATGANMLVLYGLIEPGDHVISLYPTYQQLYDIPRSLGAEVDLWPIKEELDWLPDLDDLRRLIRPNTKMICINNANNPTGAMMDTTYLKALTAIAKDAGAYILADEIYKSFADDLVVPAICDLYDKGISVNSLSKTYSIPGVRVGWVAAHREVTDILRNYRDYTMICAGVMDDFIASYALKHKEMILSRNRAIIHQNLDILKKWVANEPRADLIVPAYVSTSFVKLTIPQEIEDFCIELLKDQGVLVVPGNRFDIQGHVRIGYGCPTETLIEGLAKLSDQLRKFD